MTGAPIAPRPTDVERKRRRPGRGRMFGENWPSMLDVLIGAARTIAAAPRTGWTGTWSDGVNPILVRESTRLLSTPWFAASLVLFVGAGIAATTPRVLFPAANDAAAGPEALAWLERLVVWPTLFVELPLRTYLAARTELARPNSDALRSADVEAHRLANGLVGCALLMFFARCALAAPFAAIAYELRGVSLLHLSGLFARATTTAVLLLFYAYVCGSIAAHRLSRAEYSGGALLLLGVAVGVVVNVALVDAPSWTAAVPLFPAACFTFQITLGVAARLAARHPSDPSRPSNPYAYVDEPYELDRRGRTIKTARRFELMDSKAVREKLGDAPTPSTPPSIRGAARSRSRR
jgi:hypothetical protein